MGRRVAEALGWTFVDTGLMYRAVAWLAVKRGVGPEEAARLGELARQAVLVVEGDWVRVDGEEVGAALRDGDVEAAASRVASLPEVRAALVAKQREMAARGGVVMAGRDIGTVVLPEAPVKVYLSASPRERARRRYAELVERGRAVQEGEVLRDMLERDRRDMERELSPLRPAPDAHIIETDGLSMEQVVERILALVRDAGRSG